METNQIVNFMQAYKDLDELCRQIFSVERGISAYIDEMERNRARSRFVDYWDDDYKQLKHLRWVRNKLVHESDSFEDNLFNLEDIEWLKWFRSQIIERADPLARLYEYEERRKTTLNRPKKQIASPATYKSNHFPGYTPNSSKFSSGAIVLTIVVVAVIIFITYITRFL